ncbi:MAG: tetratricopeptide repeat protein [Deltaproteobacteria bacterium]|nr:tetratricopeptide repeat protein [Deltaproteobacteria bacterium]
MSKNQNEKKRIIALTAFGLTFITFLLYLPSLSCDFVNWDDEHYVYGNPHLHLPLIDYIKWTLTSEVVSNWHPLTMIPYGIDYKLWGLNPTGYHLTNIILHAINTLLVFALGLCLIKASENTLKNNFKITVFIALSAALLFGLHPIHVESVAWIAERKDVLSTFFFLLAVIAYLYFAQAKTKKVLLYSLSLIAFALSLMSKPMAVTLPVVLLILDYFPLNRGSNLRTILLEKIPFFFLSATISVTTIIFQGTTGAVVSLERLDTIDRILIAIRAYGLYIYKTIVPLEFAPFYPVVKEPLLFSIEYGGSALLVIVLTILSLFTIKKYKIFSAVWGYYLITLLPVIGLIQVGNQIAADRYMYIPSIGPFLLIGLGLGLGYQRLNKIHLKGLFIFILLSATLLISLKTISQQRIWKDSVTLWNYEISIYGDKSDFIHNNLGQAYFDTSDNVRAKKEFERTLQINPEHPKALNNLGYLAYQEGDLDRAFKLIKRSIEVDRNFTLAYINLGAIYGTSGKIKEAAKEFKYALALEPANPKAHFNLGLAYKNLGRIEEAISEFRLAIKFDPLNPSSHTQLGLVYGFSGNEEQALFYLKKSLRLESTNKSVRNLINQIELKQR